MKQLDKLSCCHLEIQLQHCCFAELHMWKRKEYNELINCSHACSNLVQHTVGNSSRLDHYSTEDER